jgi:cysteine synthase
VAAPHQVQVFGKAEFLNPGGSVKDRVALEIIRGAIASGRLQRGGLVTVRLSWFWTRRASLLLGLWTCTMRHFTCGTPSLQEGTVGSTGVSLAMVAVAYGIRCFIAMPDDAAIEKSQMLEALGAACGDREQDDASACTTVAN